ncbi:MAG: hypothetical protein IJW46_06290 [Clostridia bacterium]|nr:hypothetical protein [Clostridia bacterium]
MAHLLDYTKGAIDLFCYFERYFLSDPNEDALPLFSYEKGQRYCLTLPCRVVLPWVFRTRSVLPKVLDIPADAFAELCRGYRMLTDNELSASVMAQENAQHKKRYFEEKHEGTSTKPVYTPLHIPYLHMRLTRDSLGDGLYRADALDHILAVTDIKARRIDLQRKHMTGIFPRCQETLAAIDILQSADTATFSVSAIPIDEETAKALTLPYKEFVSDPLRQAYLRLCKRIARIVKLFQVNAPAIVFKNEQNLLTNSVEEVIKLWQTRELFPVDCPLYRKWHEEGGYERPTPIDELSEFLEEDASEDEEEAPADSSPKKGFDNYTGSKPYFYIACAEEDLSEFSELLSYLHHEKFRMYRADGCMSSPPDPDEVYAIAEHLENAAYVLALVGKNAEASSAFRRDVAASYRLKKEKIAVYAKEALPSPLLTMRLGKIRFDFDDYLHAETLYRDLSEDARWQALKSLEDV